MQNSQKTLVSNLMLILAAAIWGGGFVFQKIATESVGPFTFFACRYVIGGLSLLLLIGYMEYHRKSADKLAGIKTKPYGRDYFKRLFIVAPLCSLANLTGNVMVQIGLVYTNASKAGFLNSIYIIFVPILGYLFFKRKSGPNIFIGIVLAVIGLYNLCLNETFTFEKGDIIILSSTIFFALHILLVSKYIFELVGVHFSCVEFFFISIVCTIVSLCIEDPQWSQISQCTASILYAGVLAGGVSYALQVTAQKYTDPTVASLLMSLEAVFSAICGVLFLNETFTAKELIGIAFIIAAIIVSQLPERKKPIGRKKLAERK